MSKSLTKADMQRIRVLLDVRIKALSIPGVTTLALGNATFDPAGNFTFKLTGTIAGGLDAEAAEYESRRKYSAFEGEGLPPLGTIIETPNGSRLIVGAKRRGDKIIVEGQNNMRYLYPTDVVLGYLRKMAAKVSA